MKDAVIKFRLPGEDKQKIELLAEKRGKSVSWILRAALFDIQHGTLVGQSERQALVDARSSANALLHFSQIGTGDRREFELRLRRMREDAQRVLSA